MAFYGHEDNLINVSLLIGFMHVLVLVMERYFFTLRTVEEFHRFSFESE